MNEYGPARLWGMRLTFALIISVILFFQLLPLETTPTAWVGPDLLLGFAFAWSLRRPEFVPIIALAVLFLLADLLLQRPPGLWAFFALLVCERLKSRARTSRETTFASEWATAAIGMVVVALAYRLGLFITLVPTPSFGLALLEVVMTILFYPLAAALTQFGLGVRRPAPGELDRMGGGL